MFSWWPGHFPLRHHRSAYKHHDVVESVIYPFGSIGVINGLVQQSGFWNFVLWHHAWSFNGILDWGGYECQHSCSCLALSALKKTRTVESFHSSHATAGEAPLCADLKHQGTQTRLLAKTENSRQNTLVHNSSILLSLHLWRSWGESSPNTMLTSQYYNWEQMLPKWHSIWWVMNEITLSCLIDEVVSISLYL